jgi:hypothetical protein
MENTRECATCAFWDTSREFGSRLIDGIEGKCRARPPTIVIGMLRKTDERFSETAEWPVTRASDWCGEWTLRVNEIQDKEISGSA